MISIEWNEQSRAQRVGQWSHHQMELQLNSFTAGDSNCGNSNAVCFGASNEIENNRHLCHNAFWMWSYYLICVNVSECVNDNHDTIVIAVAGRDLLSSISMYRVGWNSLCSICKCEPVGNWPLTNVSMVLCSFGRCRTALNIHLNCGIVRLRPTFKLF